MSDGYLYELEVAEPARFRALGLDAAARIQGRVREAVRIALSTDPEVLVVEDELYFAAAHPQRCDRSKECRAPLHYDGCPKR